MKQMIINRMIIALIVINLAVFCLAQDFAGGSGTEADPWQIATPTHLDNVRNYSGDYFIQTANIDLGIPPWNEGEGWEPIGRANSLFNGFYDGNGNIIHNLTIRRPHTDNIGLFGYAGNDFPRNEFEISDLGLNDVDIVGHHNIGSFIGKVDSTLTTITGCYVTGSIKGDSYIGALIGVPNLTILTIENCYSVAEIISMGDNFESREYVSGFLSLPALITTITNSYIAGPVFSREFHHKPSAFVSFLSADLHSYSINKCYWNLSTTDVNPYYRDTPYMSRITGKGLTVGEMMMVESFEDWDFDNIWAIEEGETYPYLQWQREPAANNYPGITPPTDVKSFISGEGEVTIVWQPPELGESQGYRIYREGIQVGSVTADVLELRVDGLVNFTPYRYYVVAVGEETESLPSYRTIVAPVPGGYAGGRGTAEQPYLIDSAEHLDFIRHNPQAHYQQTNDIDLEHIENWEPISIHRTPLRGEGFYGSYDGNGFSISNLTVNYPEGIIIGLFGAIGIMDDTEVTLRNIRLVNADIVGRRIVGGLVGYCNTNGPLMIDNCHVSGNVEALEGRAGGLVGGTRYPSSDDLRIIKNCSSSGSVESSGSIVGGLIGHVSQTQVLDSYSASSVRGSERVGGLIGTVHRATIRNCFSVGWVRGVRNVGGLVGTGTGSQVINSYWDFDTSNQPVSHGGNARTTGQMTYPYNENTYTDWDFENIWVKDISGQVNNGYPYLYWQPVPFPNIAQNPMPPDSVINIPLDLSKLSWDYVEDQRHLIPVGFKVYFDKDDEFEEDDFFWVPYIEEQVEYQCADILPERLASGTTYYWKVVPTTNEPDERRDGGTERKREGETERRRAVRIESSRQTMYGQDSFLSSVLSLRNDAVNVPVWSFTTEETSSAEDNEPALITTLYSNHPNPFNPETTISFSLAEAGKVTIAIYNIKGQKVKAILDVYMDRGNHHVVWKGKDENNSPAGSGIYLYQMRTEDFTETRRMILLK